MSRASRRPSHPAHPVPPDLKRRHLLLAVPSGLAMASPLALLGCGGGGDSSSGGPVAGGDPPGPATSRPMAVTIELPVGVTPPAGGLSLTTITGSAPVSGNTATVDVVEDGPQLAAVLATDGTPMLYGWVGTGQPALSTQTTATVLLHFALGVPLFSPAVRDTLRDRLEVQAATQALATRIADALVADAKALRRAGGPVEIAVAEAAQALLPAEVQAADARRRPLGVVVDPAGERSGVGIVQGEALNTIFADNRYARRAVMIVNREAWFDANGQRHAEPQAPVQEGEVITIPTPTAFDSVANTLAGWANQYYAGDEDTVFARSRTDPVTLPITPDGAVRTEYSVVVLSAYGLPRTDTSRFDRLPASQRAYLVGLDLDKNLVLQTLLLDLIGPLLFAFLSERLGEFAKDKGASEARQDLMKAFAGTVIAILQTRLPDVMQKVSEGSIGVGTAFETVLSALTVDVITLEPSPLLAELLAQLAKFLAGRLADVGKRGALADVAAGRFAAMVEPLVRILGLADKALGYGAQARVFADMLRSAPMEEWKVTATKAKVRLNPEPFLVDPQGTFVPITAEIVDNDDDTYGNEKGSIRFDWVCSARYGTLFKRGASSETNTFSTSNANATCDYQPSGEEPGNAPETIEVKAWFEPIGASQAAQFIGSATATVTWKKAFNVELSPGGALDYPTEARLPILAKLKEKLPAGATVTWQWSHVGVGSVTNDSPYAALYEKQPDTSNRELVTDKAEGTATVTVRAQVDVPGSTSAPPRSVLTNPVTLQVNVKTNVETITFKPPGGAFACTDTRACGVSSYGAYLVPVMARAISYRAVFSGFGYGPCNRSVTWTGPVGDGGGCNFPISYHPHNSSGPTNMWAVWLGFGDTWNPEGECEVTIVLRKP